MEVDLLTLSETGPEEHVVDLTKFCIQSCIVRERVLEGSRTVERGQRGTRSGKGRD